MKKIILFTLLSVLLGNITFGSDISREKSSSLEKGITATILPQEKFLDIGNDLGKGGIIIPKDPLIAGLLSVQCPGLGQIYCRNYLRGVTYFAGEIGCFVLAAKLAGVETRQYIWSAINEETEEERTLTQEVTINKWDDLSGFERAGVTGLILGGIGLHVWNVIDAYNLAHEHNMRLGWIDNIDVQLGFKDSTPSVKFAVSTNF